MIAQENARKEPIETVSFVHNFKVAASEVKHMMPKQLATVFKFGLVNWHIQISESGGMHPPLLTQFMRDEGGVPPRDRIYQIALHPAGQRENHPPVQRVEFRMSITDAKDRNVMPRLVYTLRPTGAARHNNLFAGYSTPEQGLFSSRLNRIVNQEMMKHLDIHVQTLIVFDVAEFLAVEHMNRSVGRFMPLDLNFRFNLLTNRSRHDFRLTTTSSSSSESFACNKEALFVASPFFRENLTATSVDFQLDVEKTDAIRVVITWLFTETYHPPVEMCPELAGEIVKLAKRIMPRGPSQRQLFGSVERHCIEELIKNASDRELVKHMLLVAHTSACLGSLLEACHAAVISWHYHDFRKDLAKTPNAAFVTTPAFSRSSALGNLIDNYAKSLQVRCYTGKPAESHHSNEDEEGETVEEETEKNG